KLPDTFLHILQLNLTIVQSCRSIIDVLHKDTTSRVVEQMLHGRGASAGFTDLASVNLQLRFVELRINSFGFGNSDLLCLIRFLFVPIGAWHIVQNTIPPKVSVSTGSKLCNVFVAVVTEQAATS